MARPTAGPAIVQRLPGSADARRKTEIVLSTITGDCSIDDAAALLDVDRSYVFVLRDQILAGAVAAAEPRTPGPKPAVPRTDDDPELLARLEAAEQRATDAEIALELARSRIEIATVLGPRLKKTRRNPRY